MQEKAAPIKNSIEIMSNHNKESVTIKEVVIVLFVIVIILITYLI